MEGRERFWVRWARRLALQVNAGWWLQRFVPLQVAGCVAVALAVLVLRSLRLPLLPAVIGLAIWIFGSALAAFLTARRNFIPWTAGLARLDAARRLHNRLVAAQAGVGDWPPIPAAATAPLLGWRHWRVLGPLAAATGTLALAAFVPIAAPEPPPPVTIEEPAAWKSVDAAIAWMREESDVREEALDALSEKVEAMRKQSRELWYRQSTMEASDHLREQVGQGARELQQATGRAASALAAALAQSQLDRLSDADLAALGKTLKEALATMGAGTLPLNEAALSALRDVDLSKLKSLSTAQLAELEKQLREQGKCAGQCAAVCGMGPADPADGAAVAAAGANGNGPGVGGVTRGPGTAPLTLHERPGAPEALAPLALNNADMSRAALGDTLGLADDKHEVDTAAYKGVVDGGGQGREGQGGEAVWRMSVMPREREVLQKYFD